MPLYDQTGPYGLGQRTGRGCGPCGQGLGRRSGFFQSQNREEQILNLSDMLCQLRAKVEDIEIKLAEIKKQ